MTKNRLEAFSDGVLELKVPEGSDWKALISVGPVFVSCVFSYIYVGLYWFNHRHLLSILKFVDGKILWANLAWLFAMSLILTLCSVTYQYLQSLVSKQCGKAAGNFGKNRKGKFSLAANFLSMITALFLPVLSYIIFAVIWIVPDRRIEKVYQEQ